MPKEHSGTLRQSHRSPHFNEGDKFRVIGAFGSHAYAPDRWYTVKYTDPRRQMLKGREVRQDNGWIEWRHCEKGQGIDWEWLKTVLPAEVIDLLFAFDGLEKLSLRQDVRLRLVLQIPDLRQKIFQAVANERLSLPTSGDQILPGNPSSASAH